MRISILGMDYQSAIFAGCLCFRGHQVIGIDPVQSRADWLNPPCSSGLEAGLEALLQQGWQEGLLSGTTDLFAAIRDTELTFINGDALCSSEPTGAAEHLFQQIGEAMRGKAAGHGLLVRSNRARESVLAVILPALERSSGKRLGEGLNVEVRASYLDEDDVMPFGCRARGQPALQSGLR